MRLNTVLGDESPRDGLGRPEWEDLEPNPWRASARSPDFEADDSLTSASETLSAFKPENLNGEQMQANVEREEPNEESTEEAATIDAGALVADTANGNEAGQRAEVVAFRAALSEARKQAETQLASVVEAMKKAAAEERAGEVAQIADRYASELQQTKETIEAEVTKRVRQEESQRHAAEIARMREEFERRYADDLEDAQAAVVDSFKSLTTNLSRAL